MDRCQRKGVNNTAQATRISVWSASFEYWAEAVLVKAKVANAASKTFSIVNLLHTVTHPLKKKFTLNTPSHKERERFGFFKIARGDSTDSTGWWPLGKHVNPKETQLS
jgi:hypothetical protein